MKSLLLALLAVVLAACSSMQQNTNLSVSQRPFGISKSGQPATLFTLRVDRLEIDVTDHGATLVAVRAPDPAGTLTDVILGFDDVAGYESGDNQYFGCTTGRVCNRISKGIFELDGYTYRLAVNNGPNHLHGGATKSLDKVHWQTEILGTGSAPAVRFTCRSPDGEEGYPGNLDVSTTYRLDAEGMHIEFGATTDARTPVNLTNHAYWNLAGAGADTVLDHVLQIEADHYTPVDDTLIPTGRLEAVALELDFRRPEVIGSRITRLDDAATVGYDHNYVPRGTGMRRVATLRHPTSGRGFEIHTDQPGLQFYSGNWLNGAAGKGGASYARRAALCLETQHHPDSVNQPNFPSTILAPGAEYRTVTSWRFANR